MHLCTISLRCVHYFTIWVQIVRFQPFPVIRIERYKPRKPLTAKDSSIVSILESFCGTYNRNLTRPYPYHGCLTRLDSLRLPSSPSWRFDAHVHMHVPLLAQSAPWHAWLCSLVPSAKAAGRASMVGRGYERSSG